MSNRPYRALLVFALALAGCGDSASSPDADRNAPVHERPADERPADPLIGLTPERLDEFVETLRAVAADPTANTAEIAVGRGWSITEWTTLYSRVQAIVKAGSFDSMLDEARKRRAQMESSLAQYEQAVAAGGPQARNAEQAIQAINDGLTSVRRTLETAELLRPGGKLVEARVSELEGLMK